MENIDFDLKLILVILIVCALISMNIYWLSKFIRNRRNPDQHEPDTNSKFGQKIPHILYRFRVLLLNPLLIGLAIWISFTALSPTPSIDYARSYPSFNGNWEDYSKPITVVFNMPVHTSALRPFISPDELKGEWKYERYLGFLPVTRKATFYPDKSMLPGQRIVVYMTGVSRFRMNENHEHALNLFSHSSPEVFSVSPFNESNEIDVNVPIKIAFNKANNSSTKWEYKITPETAFTVNVLSDSEVELKPEKQFNQGENYTLTVYRTSQTYNIANGEIDFVDNPELIHEAQFQTVKAPLVKRFSPTGTGVREDSQIKITFEVPMQRDLVESGLQISPNFEHNFVWGDDKNLTITHANPLPKETEYTVTLPAGLKSKTGGVSEREVKYLFTTIGAVRVSTFDPQTGAVRVPVRSKITVAFDQEVDHASAQGSFGIAPNIGGSFSWEGNTMTFTPTQPLAYSTTYTATIRPGVKTVYGLDSRDQFSTSFTTASNLTLIAGFGPESFYEQRYNMTCAVASAKMALAWKGVYISEENLFNLIGREPNQYIFDGSKVNPITGGTGAYVWGDPNRGFVGTLTGGGGTDPNRSFGVYWLPIQRVFRDNYGIQTEVKTGWNIRDLANTVSQGHPVQVWAWNGLSRSWNDTGGRRMDWYTPDNRQVYAINGMHSWLIVGFYGEPSNPTSFIYLDPWRGFITRSASEFDSHWSYYNRTGLIVY